MFQCLVRDFQLERGRLLTSAYDSVRHGMAMAERPPPSDGEVDGGGLPRLYVVMVLLATVLPECVETIPWLNMREQYITVCRVQ